MLRAGDTADVLATNALDDSIRGTPAVAGAALFVRTRAHLWAFTQAASTPAVTE